MEGILGRCEGHSGFPLPETDKPAQVARACLLSEIARSCERAASERSDGLGPGLSSAYADRLFHRRDEDLAVAHGSRARDRRDRLDRLLHLVVVHNGHHQYFGDQRDVILVTSPLLGQTALHAVSLDLEDRETDALEGVQGLAYVFELLGAEYGFDLRTFNEKK